MLSNFFRINMPYGIAQNEKGEWMAFNREYMPLGYNSTKYKQTPGINYLEQPIYTSYKRITEKFLAELVDEPGQIQRYSDGRIRFVFLYNDGTNPTNQSKDNPMMWERYFDKLKKLSKLQKDERY
ncbi:hypothetical protein [Algoriphagus formosus]|uniref:hypothetical protein n=1 Tax=Algoriphagus formosus TaxID=2007308 RepID=UPI0012FE44B1|nr:hypothetical protein [Algoriphagus formosus]